jgi:hypothetical protein
MAEHAGRRGRPWRTLRQHVLARDGYICWRCGHDVGSGEVDHLIERAKGGSNTDPDNLAACHGSNAPCYICDPIRGRSCNQERRPATDDAPDASIHVDPTAL